ncbi:MAG: rod shape-determining protein RodA [Ignavibacteriae bacterium]|nr:MAG: rod shape-determining protein RodA [Ignavibacteriota bacterium]
MATYKLFRRFNPVIFFSAFGLIFIGLLAIYSATYNNPDVSGNFTKQMVSAIVGLVLVLTITFLPTRYISISAYMLYGLNIMLLVAVLFIGKKISGQTSWFSIAGFGIQPSEFAKFTTVLALATFLNNKEKDTDITNLRDFSIAVFIGLLPVGLIMLQPDTGTSLVFLAMLLPILYWAGMPNHVLFFIVAPAITAISAFLGTYYFIGALLLVLIGLFFFKKNILISTLVLTATVLSGLSVNYVYNKLQPYQQKRIIAMFSPETDALGSGYNVIQSKIAIGSGGLWGKGFLQGTQTQLKYIPEQWTDFIFCMVGEEFGFLGSLIVVILFLTLIWQTIHIAYTCKNRFLSICSIGFSSIFLFHMVINLGMTMGIMPVIGIPLPFMSYGVSFLLANLCMLGVIMNAHRNRKDYT